MSKPPLVAIAILNWNGRHYLQTLLPLLQQVAYANYAIYVIDNHSTDDSVHFVHTHFPGVHTIVLDDNYGFAKGYNLGLSHITADYYLLLNSDVELDAGFLQPMVAMMERDDGIAVVQPKILSLRNRDYFEHAGAAGGMMDGLGYPFCRGRIFEAVEKDRGQYNDSVQIFWATGTCCLIRKAAYEEVGGMYDYFFMHMEEIDLCWRLNSLGYKVMYCPQSTVYHLGGGSLPYQSAKKVYYNFRNNMVMCIRNSPWYTLLWLLPLRMAMDAAAALQFLLSGKGAAAGAVGKAYLHLFAWWFGNARATAPVKKRLAALPGVLKKSVVWQYYVQKKKLYSEVAG